jgi:hypothetical protein
MSDHRDAVSQTMGSMLLKGYKMLADSCPHCYVITISKYLNVQSFIHATWYEREISSIDVNYIECPHARQEGSRYLCELQFHK